MKFLISNKKLEDKFNLIYRLDEHSFDIHPQQERGYSSLQINDLLIEINEAGHLLYPWGLCGLHYAEEIDIAPSNYKKNTITVDTEGFIPGISTLVNPEERWPTYINKSLQWICLGNPFLQKVKYTEFAPNCVLGLYNDELQSIWLNPLMGSQNSLDKSDC
ncbi:MAG: hypothetical protein WD595_05670 [Waddliaceae bacterium]